MEIINNVYGIGVNDGQLDLFEGLYAVPKGISYHSYVIMDEKVAVMDTVDANFCKEWFANLESVLQGRMPDYLIIQHMEPDHSANISAFMEKYTTVKIVASAMAFMMMKNYFGTDFSDRQIVVDDGHTIDLGTRNLRFYRAPMVHWPEVIMTYDERDKILFSADAFGSFGIGETENWTEDARRYYFGIIGKYGVQVQNVLQKLPLEEIEWICPLHGIILHENLQKYIRLYDIWSSYAVETDGVLIAYTSVYGNTKRAVIALEEELKKRGVYTYTVDLARTEISQAVAQAFRYGKLVLATTTYNAELFPFMRNFLNDLTERNFQNRTVACIENGSWAAQATRLMRGYLEKCKNIRFAQTNVSILSAPNSETYAQISILADELAI